MISISIYLSVYIVDWQQLLLLQQPLLLLLLLLLHKLQVRTSLPFHSRGTMIIPPLWASSSPCWPRKESILRNAPSWDYHLLLSNQSLNFCQNWISRINSRPMPLKESMIGSPLLVEEGIPPAPALAVGQTPWSEGDKRRRRWDRRAGGQLPPHHHVDFYCRFEGLLYCHDIMLIAYSIYRMELYFINVRSFYPRRRVPGSWLWWSAGRRRSIRTKRCKFLLCCGY